MAYEHPHTKELWDLADQMTKKANVQKRFKERLGMFLAIYAEHGCFTRENLGPELFMWVRVTCYSCRHGYASVPLQQAVALLRLDMAIKSYSPKRIVREEVAKVPAVNDDVEVRAELLKLAPPNYHPHREEDRMQTFLWCWLWAWRNHVTEAGGQVPRGALASFVEVALKLKAQKRLSPLQNELVELLSTPYQPVVLGLKKPVAKLKLVAHA